MDVKKIIEAIKPYKDVIIFMVTLLIANYFWKFTMLGDEDGVVVTWFGLNVTAPFDIMARHIAAVVYWMTDLLMRTRFVLSPVPVLVLSGVARD